MPDDRPLDAFDPRFDDLDGREQDEVARRRTLVRSTGPGPTTEERGARIFRIAVPVLAVAVAVAVGAVFFAGLSPDGSTLVVGPARAVQDAVDERPRRVCFNGNNPCAWLTVVDGEVQAFNTNGPLGQEFGRQGVGWCPSSGWYGANATGSRWDQRGQVARGPSPRGLDRFTVTTDGQGNLVVHFASLTAGLQAWQVDGDVQEPDGPDCDEVPFDRDPDLHLPGR